MEEIENYSFRSIRKEVLEYGEFNSNNHEPVPWDKYHNICSKTHLENTLLHINFLEPVRIDISLLLVKKILENNTLYMSTGKIKPIKRLERLIQSFINEDPKLKDGIFARFSECSMKDAPEYKGKTYNSTEICRNILTSGRLSSIYSSHVKTLKPMILYLFPWQYQWVNGIEFRVFIYKGKITAISQYNWFNVLDKSQEYIMKCIPAISSFWLNIKQKAMQIHHSLVMDVCVYENSDNFTCELVEFNPFGKNYSSGSALFHWINDDDILTNTFNNVEVRWLIN